MSPFVLLRDPKSYVACPWDLRTDHAARVHWCDFFIRHVETILALGNAAVRRRDGDLRDAAQRAHECRTEFAPVFTHFRDHPHEYERTTILTLDAWRDGILRRHGYEDAFADLKHDENAKMLPLLPGVVAELDALTGREQLEAAVRGIFAGNIFDLGAEATTKAFLSGKSATFHEVRQSTVPQRPWHIDDFDALATRLLAGPVHRKCVYFIDNAGSDFLLGAIPFIRLLARRGTHVVIAANERPTLNDMTIHDVNEWWPTILAAVPDLADLPITRVSTGTGEPLIDLAAVSDQLNTAAADADLVILEGMGRGVESNLDAEFACDAINFAMVKDTAVAAHIGAKLYDVVCKFR